MRPLITIGTRPEIIKMAPIVRELMSRGQVFTLVHSGQHYDLAMSEQFLKDLALPKPDHNLEVRSGTPAEQTARALVGFERIFKTEDPDIVLAEGDTNTVLAAALAAIKLKIPVGHVEAGLRSFDRTMPEEINRILTDHASELLFAPHRIAVQNLKDEGLTEGVYRTGNTISDACRQHLPLAEEKVDRPLPTGFALLTAHRAENTDSKESLSKLLDILEDVPCQMVYPAHPRTIGKLKEFGLYERAKAIRNLEIETPVGYFEFLYMLKRARFVMTDSGGVQEESLMLGTPCVTLRYNTERPETVEAGGNILVGLERRLAKETIDKILADRSFEQSMRKAQNPYGTDVGKKIVDILNKVSGKGELKVRKSNFLA